MRVTKCVLATALPDNSQHILVCSNNYKNEKLNIKNTRIDFFQQSKVMAVDGKNGSTRVGDGRNCTGNVKQWRSRKTKQS